MIPKAPDSILVTVLTAQGETWIRRFDTDDMHEVIHKVETAFPDERITKLELVYGEDD